MADFEIVVTVGADAGRRAVVSRKRTVLLGRSTKGFHIQDPLVSLRHAKVFMAGGALWLEDLESATGTFVGDEKISSPKKLAPGATFRIGETEFVAVSKAVRPGFVIRGAVMVLLLLVALAAYAVMSVEVRAFEPKIRWKEPVRQGNNVSDILRVPTRLIRETGRSFTDLRIRRVTDFDENGVDEIWLVIGAKERVVTFSAAGEWRSLGEVPRKCIDLNKDSSFPDLRCGAFTYRFNGERYVPHLEDGAVVWMHPIMFAADDPENPEKGGRFTNQPGPARPYIFSLVDDEKLAGFLAERGVEEPIHYLICEGAPIAERAQVLTESGRIVPLTFGCIRQVTLKGANRRQWFGANDPVMVAFTAVGYQALLDDLATTIGGRPDELFRSYAGSALLAALSTEPAPRKTAIRMSFDGPPMVHFRPVGNEVPLGGYRALAPKDGKRKRPLAYSASPVSPGVGVVDGPGCSRLQIETGPFQCAVSAGCMPWEPFVTVRELGCDAGGHVVASVNYGQWRGYGRTEDVEVAIAVDGTATRLQTDALRVRVGYREIPEP